MTRTLVPAATLAGSLLLAACGGGSDAAPAEPTTVPAEAQATPEAFMAFAATTTAAQPDDNAREPLTLDGVMPPTTETAEPAPLQR